jgi:hypothetical protein
MRLHVLVLVVVAMHATEHWHAGTECAIKVPGVHVGSLPVRNYHQMSRKEHLQLGWVTPWALNTPPDHPATGLCGRVVPVPPSHLSTPPPRARPSGGVQTPPPPPHPASELAPEEARLAGYRTDS